MLQEIKRVNGFVLFDVLNQKNEHQVYRAFPEAGLGDASRRKEFKELQDALEHIGALSKEIERRNGHVISKVLRASGTTKGYRVRSPGGVDYDYNTLTLARAFCDSAPKVEASVETA